MAGQMVSVPFGNARVSRIEPLMGPGAYKTYSVSMPLGTHWRKATCEEADCDGYRNGWVSTFDLSTDLGQGQYHYCTHDKTRSYSEQRPGGTLVKLVYAPGNRCFRSADHRVPLERPARFLVADGDWRRMGRPRLHARAEDWVEDLSENQDRLITEIRKG